VPHSTNSREAPASFFSEEEEEGEEENQQLSLLSFELACASRPPLLPEANRDSIRAICYSIADDTLRRKLQLQAQGAGSPAPAFQSTLVKGIILVDDGGGAVAPLGPTGPATLHWDGAPTTLRHSLGLTAPSTLLARVCSEKDLLWALVALVRDWDVDIIACWELQHSSLGYVLERAKAVLGQEAAAAYVSALGRTPLAPPHRSHGRDEFGKKQMSDIWLTGRITLNMWRVVRKETKLEDYSLETCCKQLLGIPTPTFPAAALEAWWTPPHTNLFTSSSSSSSSSSPPSPPQSLPNPVCRPLLPHPPKLHPLP